MGNIPTNQAFKKIVSNNITDDYIQLIRGSDKTVLLWVDANGNVQGPWANGLTGLAAGSNTDVQSNSNGSFYADGNFTYIAGVQINGPIFNAATGFQIGGAAASSKFLRGNGTNFVSSSILAGDVTWDKLGNAAGNLTIANAGFSTTFNHTSAAVWTWANTTAATSLANQNSPILELAETYWNGSASAVDSWTIQSVLGTGTNPTSTLTFTQSGSPGTAALQAPNFITSSITGIGSGSSIAIPANNQLSLLGANSGTMTFSGGNYAGGSNQILVSLFRTGAAPHGFWIKDAGTRAGSFQNNESGFLSLFNVVGEQDTLTQVTVTGGTTTYTGTFPLGQSNRLVGLTTTISGFTSGGNNVTAVITSSTLTTITVATTTQVNETHSGLASINEPSPLFSLFGSVYNGSSFIDDIWTIQSTVGAGSNPTSTLMIVHSGTSGAVQIVMPSLSLSAATPTGTSGQVSFGNTQGVGNGSATNLQAPAKSTGTGPATLTAVNWLEIDIAGSKFWIPLYQ